MEEKIVGGGEATVDGMIVVADHAIVETGENLKPQPVTCN
jgi:hypothetical protein